MESLKSVKIENSTRPSPFSDHFPPSIVPLTKGIQDFSAELCEKSSSFDFTELLGIQDFTPPIFDLLQYYTHPPLEYLPALQTPAPQTTSAEALPMTPPTSSISSASTGPRNEEQSKATALLDNDDDDDDDDEEEKEKEEQQKTNKQLKPKRSASQSKKKKKETEPRFAFMTKSEVDHLEDGYRWRKYGQKAVKNSSFPRNYYRCTSARCNVKKRVERCFSDPTIVVTTYEGKHIHPSPVMTPRQATAAGFPHPLPPLLPGFSSSATFAPDHQRQLYQSHFTRDFPTAFNCGGYTSYVDPTTTAADGVQESYRFCTSTPATPPHVMLTGHGRPLQDKSAVPSLDNY